MHKYNAPSTVQDFWIEEHPVNAAFGQMEVSEVRVQSVRCSLARALLQAVTTSGFGLTNRPPRRPPNQSPAFLSAPSRLPQCGSLGSTGHPRSGSQLRILNQWGEPMLRPARVQTFFCQRVRSSSTQPDLQLDFPDLGSRCYFCSETFGEFMIFMTPIPFCALQRVSIGAAHPSWCRLRRLWRKC